MAQTKSAKKRIRQIERRTRLNRALKSRMRSAVKSAEKLPPDADAGALEAAVRKAISELDKAGRKRLIHPNAAARTKSRLAKRLVKDSGP
ncbi:MAG: 30S ribosomal protein S20 [Planctomycetota bacterium]